MMASQNAAMPVKLRGSLTTPTCEETHRAIREALAQADSLVLDCSEATEIDVSFLQILFAAQRAAERSHKAIDLAAPLEGVLDDALRRCGFAAPRGATSLAEIFPS
jgi:ABC-type transporter Mla MlaB component